MTEGTTPFVRSTGRSEGALWLRYRDVQLGLVVDT